MGFVNIGRKKEVSHQNHRKKFHTFQLIVFAVLCAQQNSTTLSQPPPNEPHTQLDPTQLLSPTHNHEIDWNRNLPNPIV